MVVSFVTSTAWSSSVEKWLHEKQNRTVYRLHRKTFLDGWQKRNISSTFFGDVPEYPIESSGFSMQM